MAEWSELHIKLAYLLGDPRQTTGTLIDTYDDDGIRYTSAYRSKLLNAGIRWVLSSLDPVFLLQNGIPTNDLVGWDSQTAAASITLGSSAKCIRLLAAYGTFSDTTTEIIPIIAPTNKRFARYFTKNSHWTATSYCYITSRTTVAFHNATRFSTVSMQYVKEFTDFSTEVDIGLPKYLHDHILTRALYMNKLNSQKPQESVLIKQALDQDIQTEKMSIEQTKQLTYNK